MEFKDFERYFSHSRIGRYLTVTGKDTERTINLYKANLRLAQTLHPLLGILEVVLRNRINDRLSAYFKDADWIINQKTGFMMDRSIKSKYLYKSVIDAETAISKKGLRITSGRVIAEQSLGFWTDLYASHHYKLLKGEPIKIFRLPSGYGRKDIYDDLTRIRLVRNRMNHNEPICFVGNNVDLTEIRYIHNSIINILNWIDPKLTAFVKDIDNVLDTVAELEKI